MNWVQCDLCELWFHLLCVGLGEDEVTEDEDYVCFKCRNPHKANLIPHPSPLKEGNDLSRIVTSLPALKTTSLVTMEIEHSAESSAVKETQVERMQCDMPGLAIEQPVVIEEGIESVIEEEVIHQTDPTTTQPSEFLQAYPNRDNNPCPQPEISQSSGALLEGKSEHHTIKDINFSARSDASSNVDGLLSKGEKPRDSAMEILASLSPELPTSSGDNTQAESVRLGQKCSEIPVTCKPSRKEDLDPILLKLSRSLAENNGTVEV